METQTARIKPSSNQEQLLRKLYYSPSEPASFSSIDRLYREANTRDPSITRANVESFLAGELTYTLHRRIVRKFRRNPVVADRHTDQAQADLIDIQKFASSNRGNRYILTVIDVFSKLAFAAPLANKKSKTVADAFAHLFRVYRPSKLQTDEGKEFTNREVQQVLKDNFITYFLAKNEIIKCSIVERFQRTLMTKIQKYMTSKGTHSFIDYLDDFVRSYNDSYHRSIKMTPFEASRCDEHAVFKNLYGFSNRRHMLKQAIASKRKHTVGAYVRVPFRKSTFDKGYRQNFSDDVFTVTRVNQWQKNPVYSIKSYGGLSVPGKFYAQELQTVEDNDRYRVRILREKGKGKNKQVLVEYENLADPPRWIKASDLLPIS